MGLAVATAWALVHADETRLVLKERGEDRLICAEYTSPAAPREPNRTCVDAGLVRKWILSNDERECH